MSAESPPSNGPGRVSVTATVSQWLTRANALLFVTLLMEGLWVYLWLVWLGHWDRLDWGEVPMTPLSIVLLLWTSYHTVQILGQQRWSSRQARITTGVCILLLMALVMRLENGGGYGLFDVGWLGFASNSLVGSFFTSMHVTLAGSAYLWWRGYNLAHEHLQHDQVFRSFLLCLAGVVSGLLFWEIAYQSGTVSGIGRSHALLVVVGFFFASLSALALSHLDKVRSQMMRQEGTAQLFSQHWSLMLLGMVTGILAASWIVAGLLSFDFLSPVLTVLSWLADLVSLLLFYIVYPFALLGAGMVYAGRWIVALLGGGPGPTIEVPNFDALRPVEEEAAAIAATPLWVIFVKWGVLLLIIGVVAFFLTRLLLRRRERAVPRDALMEAHESVGGWREFLNDLLLGLVRLALWFLGRRQRLLSHVRLSHRGAGEVPRDDMDVREMYGSLLRQTRDAGFPRHDRETPLEYMATLERRLPADRDALQRITDGYVQVRYGERAVSSEERGLLNQMWRIVHARIHRIIRGGGEDNQDPPG